MGRYIRDIRLDQPIDVVSMVMDDFVYHNRFFRTDWNGEMVFSLKDRHGKERYMKWHYVDGQFHVEAWLKNAFGGETDLKGNGAAKKEFRAEIDRLIETLKKTASGPLIDRLVGTLKKAASEPLPGGHIGSDPIHHDSGHTDDHEQWKEDTRWQQNAPARASTPGQTGRPARPASSDSNAPLAYAILALAIGWCFSVLGIIFVVMALKRADESSNPKAVKILCGVAIAGMVLGFMANIVIGILGSLDF